MKTKKRIKMRVSKNDCWCSSCGAKRKQSLEMFDICIGNMIFTLCDECNDELFRKTLKASCIVNGKLKTDEDMKIINNRKRMLKVKGELDVSVNDVLKVESYFVDDD